MSKLPVLGVQMGVFGGEFPRFENLPKVLDHVKASGFTAVEGGHEGGVERGTAIRELLEDRGMRWGGSHTVLRPLSEQTQAVGAFVLAAGGADVCNSGYLDWKHSTYDEVRRSIDLLNEAGRKLRAMGVHLHYHNHDFEFQTRLPDADNRTIMEVTLAGLDPACCDLCIDTAWVHRGLGLTRETAGKAAAFLRENAGKIGYIHLKDWSATAKGPKGEQGFWTELGRGDVDNRACLEEIRRNERVRFVMWEQDATVNGAVESCRVSGEYLKQFGR